MFGNVVLVAVPGEFTTMCGRRVKDAVKSVVGKNNTEVIIAGLSNIYSSYVTTFEEYQVGTYESWC